MGPTRTEAIEAFSYLLRSDLEGVTREQEVAAETALRAHPGNWELLLAVKRWAAALVGVCRLRAAEYAKIQSGCGQDVVTEAMNTLLLALCDHLGLPADPLQDWPKSNALRAFALQVSGAPIELIDGDFITKPTLPRWEPKSRLGRRIAGLDPHAPHAQAAAFLSIEETEKELRGLEEFFRNALFDGLPACVNEAVLAAHKGPHPIRASTRNTLPKVKKIDLSRYLEAAGLTERQRQCISLRWEYVMRKTDIARHLGINRKTLDEHLAAAESRLEGSGAKQHAAKKLAKVKPGGIDTR